jgi:hypothetical protein
VPLESLLFRAQSTGRGEAVTEAGTIHSRI